MLGAIAGDIIGSVYECEPIKTTNFPLFRKDSHFTDDSVMTVAIADAILSDGSYLESARRLGRAYPDAGYGTSFRHWLQTPEPRPYNSWGNGSAMRVSPVGFAFQTETEVMGEAKRSAEFTHNHPEGIKGAQAVALAVFLARTGCDKSRISMRIEQEFGYDLSQGPDDIRPYYGFDVSCQGSVPQAIVAFLHAGSYEEAVRIAVSLGGDSDTLACMAGAIAQARYGIPEAIVAEVRNRLPDAFWSVIETFTSVYLPNRPQND